MTQNETACLAAVLAISDKVMANNAAFEDEQTIINSITDQEPAISRTLFDMVREIVEKTTKDQQGVAFKLLNGLTGIAAEDKINLTIKLMARNIDVTDTIAVAQFIDYTLANQTLKYDIYNILVRLAISLGDPVRIRALMDKIGAQEVQQ